MSWSLLLMEWSMRTRSSRTSVGWAMDEMYCEVPRLGLGKVPAFSMRTALGSIRLAGITFPGKGWPSVKPSALYMANLPASFVGTIGTVPFDGTVYVKGCPATGKLLAAIVFLMLGVLP